MKRALVVLLMAMFVLTVGLSATAVRAEDQGTDTAVEHKAKRKTDGDGAAAEKPAKKTEKTDKTGDATVADNLKQAADQAQTAEEEKPLGNTPYEKKMGDIKKHIADADKLKEKLPEVESKVNAEVAKLKEGDRPADTKKLQEELARHGGSQNAKAYQKWNGALASYIEGIIAKLHKAVAAGKELEDMKAPDDDVKARGEALAASAKEQYIEMLLKVASVYERIAETAQTQNAYRRILAVDKENSAALTYFKEAAKPKEKKEETTSSGSGKYSGARR